LQCFFGTQDRQRAVQTACVQFFVKAGHLVFLLTELIKQYFGNAAPQGINPLLN
jgi:hypothetical protein